MRYSRTASTGIVKRKQDHYKSNRIFFTFVILYKQKLKEFVIRKVIYISANTSSIA